jgi:DNA-binding response OmpR family regulator
MSRPNFKIDKIQRAVIIEDDDTARDIISDFLEDEGYKVLSFDSTKKAEEVVQPTDILIVDVRIGKEPSAGVDFVISLRENNPQFKATKTIFISNFGRFKQIEEKLQQLEGKFIWIDKPLEMFQLAHAIENE